MKTCSKCGFVGDESLFMKDRDVCKKCKTIYDKINRGESQEEIDFYFYELELNNNGMRICTICNFIGDKNLFAKDQNKCKECVKKNRKDYGIQNKETIKERRKIHRKNQKKDPIVKLLKICGDTVREMLKSKGSSKNGKSSRSFFPFTADELKKHIEALFEPWMNWNNHGIYNPNTWDDNDPSTWTWQLDHIIPQSNYPYSEMGSENFNIIWALSNLRPYSAKQNILDGASRIRHNKTA